MIQAKEKLSAHGIAITRQRVLILKSMLERKDHPDAEAVFLSLIPSMPLLSLDTVYRTLKFFTQEAVAARNAGITKNIKKLRKLVEKCQ